MNSNLNQVLADGTNTYLYGPSASSGQASRISQENATGVDYFLGDAIGNVRQMISGDAEIDVVLAREYSPYSEIAAHSGNGKSDFGFTGEMQAGGLVHLRARDYATDVGRFLTRDSWEGNYSRPLS